MANIEISFQQVEVLPSTGLVVGCIYFEKSTGIIYVAQTDTLATPYGGSTGQDGAYVSEDTLVIENISGEGGGSATIPVVVVEGTSVTQELQPNTYYEFGEVTELNITLADEIPNIYNEYMFEFTSGSTAATLTLPSDIKWIGDESPTIGTNRKYQISVVNGVGVVGFITMRQVLTTELTWNLYNGELADFKIDDKSYTSSDSSAEYSIGSVIIQQGDYGDHYLILNYLDGSTERKEGPPYSSINILIAKEISSITIGTTLGGGTGN